MTFWADYSVITLDRKFMIVQEKVDQGKALLKKIMIFYVIIILVNIVSILVFAPDAFSGLMHFVSTGILALLCFATYNGLSGARIWLAGISIFKGLSVFTGINLFNAGAYSLGVILIVCALYFVSAGFLLLTSENIKGYLNTVSYHTHK